MNVSPAQVSSGAVLLHVTDFVLESAVEIGILCLAGGAPAVPAIPYILIKNLAGAFFGSIEEIAGAHGSLFLFTATAMVCASIAGAFIVASAAAGIIGPLGIAVYSTLLTLGVLINSARVLRGVLTIASGECLQQI